MSTVSVKQPLILYATLFMLLFAAVVVTLNVFSLLSGVNRAYRRAVTEELQTIAANDNLASVRKELRRRAGNGDVEIEVVTATVSAFGLGLTSARELTQYTERSRYLVSVRLQTEATEAYVVARIDPTIPAAIAKIEAAKVIFPVLLGALACAALMALMMRRLLLPSLGALAAIAKDPSLRPDGLVGDAPNEILEVAQTFRLTVRQLNEERERIRAQHEELARMQASLIRASKLASVGRLAAGIAHEIGNPLAAVQGYLALLPRLDEGERKEVVERSAKELKRIHETIKKLLAYARQEEPSEPSQPISTATVVNDAILLVRGHPAMRNVEIARNFDAPASNLPSATPPADRDAIGSADRLGQVLVNLLLNAAQAMDGAESPKIEIVRESKDGTVELSIKDNGPGIPADKLEQIFDPFYTTKAPGEGTGLGLAVSRSLMEAMGGDLTVTSEPGRGACFTIRLVRSG